MLSRRHPRGAPVAGAAGDARARRIRCPDSLTRRRPVAGREPRSCRISARWSYPRPRASDRLPLTPYAASTLGVAEGDTRARRSADAGGPITDPPRLTMPRVQLRRHSGPDAQLLGIARPATSRPNATRVSSRIRAKPRCKGSPRCAHSRRAAIRRPSCRRTSGRYLPALRALGFSGSDAAIVCSVPRGRAGSPRRVLVRRGDVGRERRHSQPFGGHRRRPRAFHAGKSRHRHFHRSLEAPTTTAVLRAIFADAAHFVGARSVACRAAVRRRRRGQSHAIRGRFERARRRVLRLRQTRHRRRHRARTRFPARQTREAFAAIARRHGLAPARTVFAQQNPVAIDAGVFHNDVISGRPGHTCCSATNAPSSISTPCSRRSRRGSDRHSRRSSCASAR